MLGILVVLALTDSELDQRSWNEGERNDDEKANHQRLEDTYKCRCIRMILLPVSERTHGSTYNYRSTGAHLILQHIAAQGGKDRRRVCERAIE